MMESAFAELPPPSGELDLYLSVRAANAVSESICSRVIREPLMESRVPISWVSTLSSRYSRMPITLTAVATTMPRASSTTLASVSLTRREWMPRSQWNVRPHPDMKARPHPVPIAKRLMPARIRHRAVS